MIEYISHNNRLLSIILRTEHEKNGIEFFTPDNFSQQLAYMKRPKDYTIPPHVHNDIHREVHYTKEVLFIKSGSLRVDYYDDEQTYLESRVLKKGDVLLLAYGGHGFTMLEESEIIEVKQGPYAGERDKTRFEGIQSEACCVKNDGSSADNVE